MSARPPRTIEEVLAAARQSIARWTPAEALVRTRHGAELIDIRPYHQRLQEGEIPGSLVIERNVLEWRLDPASPHRIGQVHSRASEFIIVCSQGYTSSLAASSLVELGLVNSGDIIGGVLGWIDEGLPWQPGGTMAGERVPGVHEEVWRRLPV